MEISLENRSGIGVISVSGSLDASVAEKFNKEFDQYFENTNKFVFDLSGLDFLDSAGLGRLVSALKKVSMAKGEIKIACIPEKIMMVFQVTRAFKIFDMYDSVEEAVNSMQT